MIESLLLRVVIADSHISVLTLPDGMLIYLLYLILNCGHILEAHRLIGSEAEIEIPLY